MLSVVFVRQSVILYSHWGSPCDHCPWCHWSVTGYMGTPQPPSWPHHIGTLPSPPGTPIQGYPHTGIPPYKLNFFHYVAQTVIWHSTEMHSYLFIISTRRWRCGKATFSVISHVCYSVHRGSHVTTADLLKLVHLGTPWIGPCPNPQHLPLTSNL